MTIKNKVILSNILSFILPILAGLISMNIMFNAIDNYALSNDYVLLANEISDSFKSGKEDYLDSVNKIEKIDYDIKIILDDEIEYESENYDGKLEKILGAGNSFDPKMDDFNFFSESGEISKIKFETSEDKNVSMYIIRNYNNPSYEIQKENIDNYKNRIYRANTMVLLIIILTIVIITSITSYIISKSVLKPLNKLRYGIEKIDSGDLNFRVSYSKQDEFGQIFKDFEGMRNQLFISKEEKEKYDRNRSELIAGITHDLNTPLTSIKGYTSGLLDGIISSKDKQDRYLRSINSTVDHMSSMINELFLYSTLDVDGIKFNFIETDLVDFFSGIVIEIEDNLKQENMNIVFKTDLSRAVIEIDWLHFKRAVLNIINNSVKYKKNEVGDIEIDLIEEDNFYLISFKDSGRGISKEEINQVFNPFYRADKSRNQKTGGTGLGLAIVKSIIEAHGGSIEIDKDYRMGLRIIIRLEKR